MKSVIISLLALVCFTTTTNAQVKKKLKKVIELKMPKTVDDDMPGTRGANVAYNPTTKLYYAAFAGNQGYPLAVFDVKGKRLSDEDLTTEADLRGLWYNPVTKTLQGNCYSEGGWVTYKLDAKGMPKSPVILLEGMNQPSEQSVGAYEAASKTIYFLKANTLVGYNAKGVEGKTITLDIETEKDEDDADMLPEKYNYTTAISTGLPKMEFGLYNTEDKTVELYSKANGKKTATWQLPDDLPTTEISSFNFSYANGIVWLFDIDNRKWYGYR